MAQDKGGGSSKGPKKPNNLPTSLQTMALGRAKQDAQKANTQAPKTGTFANKNNPQAPPAPRPPTGAFTGEILKIGSRGNAVAILQSALGLKPDGVFGPQTANALKAVQAKAGIAQDGIYGGQSAKALLQFGAGGSGLSGGGGGNSGPAPGSDNRFSDLSKFGGGLGGSSSGGASSGFGGFPVGGVGGAMPAGPTAADLQATLDSLMKRATSSVDGALNPQLKALQDMITLAETQGNRGITETTEFGQRAESDLQQLADRSSNYIANKQRDQGANYQGYANQSMGINRALQQQTSAVYGGGEDRISDELARLGLGQAGAGALDGIQNDAQFAQQRNQTSMANQLNMLSGQRGAFDAVMELMQANTKQEGVSNVSKVRTGTQDALRDLRNQMGDQVFKLNSERSTLEGTRGQKIQELFDALEGQQYSRDKEDEQSQFERLLASEKLGLSRDQFAASNEQEIAKIRIAQREAMAKLLQPNGGSGGSAAAAKTPSGYSASLDFINGLNGPANTKQDLATIMGYVLGGGPRGEGNGYNPYDTKDNNKIREGIAESLKAKGLSEYINQMMQALAILQGKG